MKQHRSIENLAKLFFPIIRTRVTVPSLTYWKFVGWSQLNLPCLTSTPLEAVTLDLDSGLASAESEDGDNSMQLMGQHIHFLGCKGHVRGPWQIVGKVDNIWTITYHINQLVQQNSMTCLDAGWIKQLCCLSPWSVRQNGCESTMQPGSVSLDRKTTRVTFYYFVLIWFEI